MTTFTSQNGKMVNAHLVTSTNEAIAVLVKNGFSVSYDENEYGADVYVDGCQLFDADNFTTQTVTNLVDAAKALVLQMKNNKNVDLNDTHIVSITQALSMF